MLKQKVNILGVRVSFVDLPALLNAIDKLAEEKRPALINNVNAHACNLAYICPEFREVLNSSEIVFCDGFGVKLAAAILGEKLGQRMTPPDWIDELFTLCAEKSYRVYFLGDEEEVVRLFVEAVQKKHPDLQIAGYHHGFFNQKGAENDRIIRGISASDADIIITGMGMPRQELWAAQAKQALNKGVFIATGALFRWYSGCEKRVPRWMTDHGMEWLGRLICSPLRHFRRYVIGLPLFYLRIIRQKLFSSGLNE